MGIQKIISALDTKPGNGSPVHLDETTCDDTDLRSLAAAVNRTNSQRWEMQRTIDDFSTRDTVYKTAVMESPTPMLLVDRDLKIVGTNNAFTAMSGLGQVQLTGMDLHNLSVTTVKGKRIIDAMVDNTIISGESIIDLPGGKKYLTQRAVPVADPQGVTRYILVYLKDLTTEREQDEKIRKAIEEGEQRNEWFAAVLDSIPYPISVTDPLMHWTGVNQAFAETFGIDRTAVIGQHCSATNGGLCHSEKCVIRQLQKSGKKRVSAILERGERTLKVGGAHLATAHGEQIGFIEVIEDITSLMRQQKETEERAARLAESARELKAAMSAMAGQDLTFTLESREDDPLRVVKEDYLETRDGLRGVTLDLAGAIREIKAGTGEASRSVEGIAQAVEEIAGQSQKNADDSRDQLTMIEGSAEAMTDLSASVEEIAGTCQEVLQVTEKSAEIGEEANKIGQTAAAKMEEVKTASKESVEEISKLNAQMQEIDKIVKLITDISNQTNLLALNAAIEAARAGEHGRGFAVVAGEVRNLAGESKKATGQIEDLITTIHAQSTRASQEIEGSYTRVHAGIERVGQTLDALDQMVRMSGEIRASVTEIARATEDQANDTTRVTETMEETKKKTRANLKAIEEVAALIEEVSASAEEAGGGAQEVASMAAHLEEMIDHFKLE
ncbi:methyl-accepting chemotaxis protein [Methanofollis sp. W23]|uniref:methyl-accepting chemotaxis protein n=1 Tax=Methanofollis sp. W23 TaxID=2817849 RepID=UPI001AE3EB32|nr:PAS domain-containing methyl-accepting chemotaxis protein [Methanofollis sp. W23]MBP2145208.1 methyl-accepting chemotaxis protein [Methanofollis sp. W23]